MNFQRSLLSVTDSLLDTKHSLLRAWARMQRRLTSKPYYYKDSRPIAADREQAFRAKFKNFPADYPDHGI